MKWKKCNHADYCPDGVCTPETGHCRDEFGYKCSFVEEEIEDVGIGEVVSKTKESKNK